MNKIFRIKIISTLFIGLLFFSSTVSAQELNCKCSIKTPKVQKTDPKVFEDLRNVIEDFLNNKKWTEDQYEPEEKIDCDLVITIVDEGDNNYFTAEMAIQASRPVFGSTYMSNLITHSDKDIAFIYEQFQPVVYNENSYVDNLSAVLSFYAYFILGLDYDSFSPYGGEDYLNKAQEIVNQVPQSAASQFGGWSNSESTRNRYWMIESTLNPKSKPMRLAFYDYHRTALDQMSEKPDLAKVVLAESLEEIKKVSESYQNAMIVQMFAQAKGAELVEIFTRATKDQKTKIYNVLKTIDPSNASKYIAITRN